MLLILARHGNTFGPEDTPVWVGANEDLPLVEKGLEQSRAMGEALRSLNQLPDRILAGLSSARVMAPAWSGRFAVSRARWRLMSASRRSITGSGAARPTPRSPRAGAKARSLTGETGPFRQPAPAGAHGRDPEVQCPERARLRLPGPQRGHGCFHPHLQWRFAVFS